MDDEIYGAGSLIIRGAERMIDQLEGDSVATMLAAVTIGATAGLVAVTVDPVGTAIKLVRDEMRD